MSTIHNTTAQHWTKSPGEANNFKCRPTLKGLLYQLEKLGKYFPEYMLTLFPRVSGRIVWQYLLHQYGQPVNAFATIDNAPPQDLLPGCFGAYAIDAGNENRKV